MSTWTIDKPTTLDFDGVVALKVHLAGGSVSVLATDERPTLHVDDVTGEPLEVSHEAGILTVGYGPPAWDGLRKWVRAMRGRATITVSVPKDCPVQVMLVSANAVIAGLTARTSIKSASGGVTLDGVTGQVDANTVSGAIEAQGLDGSVRFNSVSGDLALAGGLVEQLGANTVSGRVAADVDLVADSRVRVSTVSGEVTLRLPESTSAQVNLNTAAGRVETTFTDLDNYERTIAKSVVGKLGDGSGTLAVSTVSGNVTLLSRPDDKARRAGEPNEEIR